MLRIYKWFNKFKLPRLEQFEFVLINPSASIKNYIKITCSISNMQLIISKLVIFVAVSLHSSTASAANSRRQDNLSKIT